MSAFAPFDASKYAFRTNFDGLTARDAASSARVEQVKRAYQNALENFENQDKEARKEYQQAKNDGLTTKSFEDWVHSDVSLCELFQILEVSLKNLVFLTSYS